jgi:2-methylcitrate dehydratase PrpD
MAEEPDNLVLKMLREIRAKQDEHSVKLDAHSQILERLDSEVQEIRHSVIYSLGLGTTQGWKNSEQDRRLDEQKKRTDELFDKLEELLGRS